MDTYSCLHLFYSNKLCSTKQHGQYFAFIHHNNNAIDYIINNKYESFYLNLLQNIVRVLINSGEHLKRMKRKFAMYWVISQMGTVLVRGLLMGQ